MDFENLETLPISFNYQFEDAENFQEKKGNEAFNITIPANIVNDKIFNTYHNPSVEDLTAGKIFKNHRVCSIIGNGYELLVGKSFLIEATHTHKPTNYKINCYGGNADWIIDLKEVTLFDVLKDITFPFTKAHIEASWLFDGTDSNLPYVFAPAKYGNWLDDTLQNDNNVTAGSMKPAFSFYWMLFRIFKYVGYQIKGDFIESDYFRRAVLPWVWGNFLSSEGTKYEIHKFRSKSINHYFGSGSMTTPTYVNIDCSNDSTDGMFDNNNTVPGGDYSWLPANQNEMRWTYNTPHFGNLDATFSISVGVDVGCWSNSNSDIWVDWFKNGVLILSEKISHVQAPFVSTSASTDTGIKEAFFTINVNPGDTVSARIKARRFESKLGSSHQEISIEQFQLDYFRIPLGGTISFDSYNGFKKIKVLDVIRGFIDAFNIAPSTDAINKVVLLEPHDNFFNGDFIDWSNKQDLKKDSVLTLFSDYEREVYFKFKDDTNDGIFKLIQDRNANVLGAGKYVFPDRFKTGKKEYENRFFSHTLHYEADQFKSITGVSPQMVVIVPENISNTSRSEAQNTFNPKLCWYKGITNGVGGWKWDGIVKTNFPYMFAVNYKDGGESDPIFSYSDEKIGSVTGAEVIGKGLLKKFFWQRLAIMRNGQFYTTFLQLNNYDVSLPWHREYKIIQGQKWELIQINEYKPLQFDSTKCFLKKWHPVTLDDFNATFPSSGSVLSNSLVSNQYDIKYAQLKCLASDLPTPE